MFLTKCIVDYIYREDFIEKRKQQAIEVVVDTAIQSFSEGLISRYTNEVEDVNGVINMKKNNCFIAELGAEFMFYSA